MVTLTREHGAHSDIAGRCERFALDRGFPHYLLILHLLRSGQPRQIVIGNYPRAWTELYDQRGYLQVDPVVRRLLDDVEPFAWDSLECTQEQQAFFREAARHGLGDGLSVPLQRANGEMAALCLAGAPVCPDPAVRDSHFAAALLFAVRIIGELRRMEQEQLPGEVLTERQKDILTQVANGSSIRHVAQRLGVHPRSVEDALRRAMDALQVQTREQAIVRAVLGGLIAPLPYSSRLSPEP